MIAWNTGADHSDLPNVVIMATGGTIAGVGAGATASGSYTAGVVGVEALVQGEFGHTTILLGISSFLQSCFLAQ